MCVCDRERLYVSEREREIVCVSDRERLCVCEREYVVIIVMMQVLFVCVCVCAGSCCMMYTVWSYCRL